MTNANDTLDQALGLLGYREDLPSHYRSNLIHAIQLYAGVSGNEGLGYACEARLNLMQSENEADRDSQAKPQATQLGNLNVENRFLSLVLGGVGFGGAGFLRGLTEPVDASPGLGMGAGHRDTKS